MKARLQALIIASMLLIAPALTHAQEQAQDNNENKLESSALLKGSIVIATDGSVLDVQIENPKKQAGPELLEMVHNAAMKWRFKPVMVDGVAVVAKSSMAVRLIAKKQENGSFVVRIKGATFGGTGANSPDTLRHDRAMRVPPKYPMQAARAGVEAIVYLIIQVGRDGHVMNVAVEQTNILGAGSDDVVGEWRKLFEESSIQAARRWTFHVPTEGKLANDDSWYARAPMNFIIDGRRSQWGSFWVTYTPGPRKSPDWMDPSDAGAVDALAGDGLLTTGAGPTLLTPLNQG